MPARKLASLASSEWICAVIQFKTRSKKTAASSSGFSRVRLAFLASSTIGHLLPAIRVAGLRRRLLIEVYQSPYAQYRQELFDPLAQLHRFAPDVVLFSLTSSAVLSNVSLGASAAEADEAISAALTELRELWLRARESFNATIVQQSFLDVSEPLLAPRKTCPGVSDTLVAALNDLLPTQLHGARVVADVARASARWD